jgi:hypothetical protein
MIRGMAGLMVALGASACGEDPSLDFGGEAPTQVQVTPSSMFITQGVAEQVLARLIDDRNRSTPTSFEISNVSAGLTVRLDTLYRPDNIGSDSLEFNPIQHQHRFFVTGESAVAGSFTVSSSGFSQVVTVKVVASTLGTNLSSTAPQIGDVVTLTLPANLSFTTEGDDMSVITVGGNDVVVTEMTSTSVSFVPFPGSSGPVSATGIITDYSPTLATDTLSTDDDVVVPAVAPVTLSSTSPAIGEAVVVTAGAGQEFSADATVTFPNADGSAQLEAVKVSQTATTITVLPIPGSNGPATVHGVILTPGEAELLGEFEISSEAELTVPSVESIPLVFSTATPAAGQTVTISAAGVEFHQDLAVSFGGDDAFVVSVAADGSSAVILPPTGVDGEVAVVSNFNLASLEPVTLVDVPSVATMTTTANYAPAGGGGTSFGTAIALSNAVTPTQGAFAAEAGPVTFGPDVNYLGGSNFGGPRYYVLTVATAGTYDINMGWGGGGDFDLYLRDAADAEVETSAGSGNPEHVEAELEPGTYYIVFHNWQNDSGNPTSVLITVKAVVE